METQPTDVHEFAVGRYQTSFTHDQQVETMQALDKFFPAFKGFKYREYFYSQAENQWVDHIVWESLEDAKASEKMLENPEAAALFARMDSSFQSGSFGRYRLVHQAAQ